MVTPIWIGSTNFTRQSGYKKRHISLHWMVGNLRGTDVVFNRKGYGSAQYGIEGGVVHQYVAEDDYAWADGSTYGNRYGVSIEHAGGWLLPNGSRQKPSAATHETSAQLCADIARRWGMGKLVVGKNLYPHNHWVATQCPGSLDIHWIAARANEIMGMGGPVGPTGPASGGVSNVVREDQKLLLQLGADLGPWGADGIRGAATIAATVKVQKELIAAGYDLGVWGADGKIGTYTRAAMKAEIKKRAGTPVPDVKAPAYPLPAGYYFGPQYPLSNVRSVSGYHGNREHLRRWQQRMKDRGWVINPDGLYGPQTAGIAEAFQREKGLTVDRLIGPQTWSAAWTAPIT